MGIFDIIGDSLRTGFAGAKQFAKGVAGGVLSGITKGLATGRQIIDVGKDVLSYSKNIPYIGSEINNVLQVPLNVLDKGVSNLQDIDVASHNIGRQYSKSGFRGVLGALPQYGKSVISAVNLIPK